MAKVKKAKRADVRVPPEASPQLDASADRQLVEDTKKRDDRVVTYVRVRPEEHAQIAQIAKKRGYPHTIASVASEMITRGLGTETLDEMPRLEGG